MILILPLNSFAKTTVVECAINLQEKFCKDIDPKDKIYCDIEIYGICKDSKGDYDKALDYIINFPE